MPRARPDTNPGRSQPRPSRTLSAFAGAPAAGVTPIGLLARILLLGLASACGGGGGGGGSGNAVSLVSIAVSPQTIQLPHGFSLQLAAIGQYSDATTRNITEQVSWSTADVTIATVGDAPGQKGLLAGIALGDTLVTATFDGLSGARTAHVIDPVLTQIQITPFTFQMAVGASKALSCSAFYVGGYSRDVTADTVWSTSDAGIATVSNQAGAEGEVSAHATGACQILADYQGFGDSAELTVIEVEILDLDVSPSFEATAPSASIDGTGDILAIWGYEGSDPGRLYWRRHVAGGAWTDRKKVADPVGKVLAPRVVGNAAGQRFAFWSSESGLWCARYEPSLGWEAPLELDAGASSALFVPDVQAVVHASGDAWVVWRTSEGGDLLAKAYQAGVGWGATTLIGDTGSSQHPVALGANAAGESMLLWQSFVSGLWTLYASRYTPAGGLETPYVLYSSSIYHQPAIDVDAGGTALAVFVDFTVFPTSTLYAARYVAGSGWEAAEVVSDLDTPREPRVALDPSGEAFVIWRHATVAGTGLSGSRYVPGDGWEERALLVDSPGGAPIPLAPQLDGAGGIVAYWRTNSSAEPKRLGLARYLPGSGWEEAQSFDFMGSEGIVLDLQLAQDPSGQAIVTWSERHTSGDTLYAHRF